MISMQLLGGVLLALTGLVGVAFALATLLMAVPRVSYPGQAPRGGTRPDGDIQPDLSPEPEFVIPDDARELTGDRELILV